MNYKTLLKSFSILALVLAFSTHIYASEVTGNLSSSNTQDTDGGSSSGSEVGGTLDNGIILAGNVSGGSSSGSSRGSSNSGNGGFVLGASTVQDVSQVNNLSSDGMSLSPSTGILALGTETSESVDGSILLGVETTKAATPLQAAVITDESSGINWLWIILLALLLVTTGIYFYNLDDRKTKTKQL